MNLDWELFELIDTAVELMEEGDQPHLHGRGLEWEGGRKGGKKNVKVVVESQQYQRHAEVTHPSG